MKVYLAAYETAYCNVDMRLDPHYNVFLTYYYEPQANRSLPHLKASGHKGLITIDSGAHSFFAQNGVSAVTLQAQKSAKAADPDTYFMKYAKWVRQNYEYFDYFVELDIQELVGQGKVDRWRQHLKDLGVFDKCIMVHHSCNSTEEFYKLLDLTESKYIGMEGPRNTGKGLKYMELLKDCYDRQIKVHGFALTKPDFMRNYPFYSVDSSSWTMVNRYGSFQKFDRGLMRTVSCSKEAHFFKHGIPVEFHSQNRDKATMRAKLHYSAREYDKLEKFYTSMWEKRGIFWKD